MARPLLDVDDRAGERSVHCAALPDRRLLVADRREQRMGKAHPRVVELDHAFLDCRLERLEHAIPVAIAPS